jgi:hypothetical protein
MMREILNRQYCPCCPKGSRTRKDAKKWGKKMISSPPSLASWRFNLPNLTGGVWYPARSTARLICRVLMEGFM